MMRQSQKISNNPIRQKKSSFLNPNSPAKQQKTMDKSLEMVGCDCVFDTTLVCLVVSMTREW
jgi:hypothetical protein